VQETPENKSHGKKVPKIGIGKEESAAEGVCSEDAKKEERRTKSSFRMKLDDAAEMSTTGNRGKMGIPKGKDKTTV